jgi:hypothetical protein
MLMPKACFGWSDTSFNKLLRILGFMLPKDNKVPTNTYQAKKLIRPVTLNLHPFFPLSLYISYIGAPSMRAWRAVHTTTWVDTRVMLCVMWMRTTREPQVGQRRRRPRRAVWGTSHLMRRKLHAEENSYPVDVVPTHDRSPMLYIWEPWGCLANVLACVW